ncbi:MAG TPA: methylated-DNA--[protein]-cysteine S-methyltransferase [Burkholderiaceae bacterium]|nr:methylated-DNA--[protein]-cysteine S-methyltransferase [Burkholderiaceae bacterium]
MHIHSAEFSSPMGTLHLLWDAQQRLLALEFADLRARMHTLLSRQYREELVISTTAAPAPIVAALAAYFDGEISALDALPVHHGGTAFQQTVWQALRTIPAGQTLSYGALAQRIGHPAAVRAVGLANGANPVAIVVPCHRVIGANGQLTGYGGGLDRKRWLLDHEARHAPGRGQLF